jgi:hypothetical protein
VDGYAFLHFLDRKYGPLSVRGWIIGGYCAYFAYAMLHDKSAPLREADRIAQRARSWRGWAEELAEALTEPLADRLAGALARRGAFVIRADGDRG